MHLGIDNPRSAEQTHDVLAVGLLDCSCSDGCCYGMCCPLWCVAWHAYVCLGYPD
jgi:hypothetical protein